MSGNSLIVHPLHLFPPEHARFHDVRLLRRAHPALPLAGELEGDAGDPADLLGRVDLRVDAAAAAVRQRLDAARLAEIDAAGELADDHHVEPADDLRLQRRGIDERIEDHRRPQVGEQRQVLAQAQQAALGLLGERQRVPLRAADGAEQHGIGGERIRHRPRR